MPNKWTFKVIGVKEFIESNLIGDVLVPFGGMEKLEGTGEDALSIATCDIKYPNNEEAAAAEFNCDARFLDKSPEIKGKKYRTVVLDPPFTFFQASRSYNLNESQFRMSDVVKAKDEAFMHCIGKNNCRVITLGFNSTGMGKERGFKLKKMAVINHGGNRNDTLITVEDYELEPKERYIKKMKDQHNFII